MKTLAGRTTRIALAVVVAAAILAVAIVSSSVLGAPRTVTSTSVVTSIVTRTASLTVTDVTLSNRTVTVNMTEDRPYALIINTNATVPGEAVGIPGCAVHAACTSEADQSSTAMLILYGGTYYYVSNYTFTSLTQPDHVYTVWYTNSTDYCISPETSWDPVCPNAVFIPDSPTQTQTSQTTETTSSCTVTGEGGSSTELVTDLGVPVQSQQIQVVQKGPVVNGQSCGTVSLPTLITNSTGWLQIPAGDGLPYAGSFVVSFVYSGQPYNATITIYPLTAIYVTFYVPSGVQATTDCPNNVCPTYTDSMTMGS